MSESKVLFPPHVVWKIKGVAGFGRIKGPSFAFLGARWKLKFVYCESDEGIKSVIILKKYGDCAKNVTLTVTTSLTVDTAAWHDRSARLTDLSCREWIIWDVSNVKLSTLEGFTILSLFQKNYYFSCVFDIDNAWAAENITNSTEQPGAKITEFSPCISSLRNDLGNMFNNHLMSDVIMECEDIKIYAHRFVLAARSEVFAAMFRNDMKEAKEKTVVIRDVEHSVLEQMVRYMYSGDILDLTPDNVHKVYVAADRYGVEALKMKCGVFMVENTGLTIPASTAVVAASESGGGVVKEAVLSHFANIKSLFGTDEWKKLCEKEPKFANEAFQFFLNKSF